MTVERACPDEPHRLEDVLAPDVYDAVTGRLLDRLGLTADELHDVLNRSELLFDHRIKGGPLRAGPVLEYLGGGREWIAGHHMQYIASSGLYDLRREDWHPGDAECVAVMVQGLQHALTTGHLLRADTTSRCALAFLVNMLAKAQEAADHMRRTRHAIRRTLPSDLLDSDAAFALLDLDRFAMERLCRQADVFFRTQLQPPTPAVNVAPKATVPVPVVSRPSLVPDPLPVSGADLQQAMEAASRSVEWTADLLDLKEDVRQVIRLAGWLLERGGPEAFLSSDNVRKKFLAILAYDDHSLGYFTDNTIDDAVCGPAGGRAYWWDNPYAPSREAIFDDAFLAAARALRERLADPKIVRLIERDPGWAPHYTLVLTFLLAVLDDPTVPLGYGDPRSAVAPKAAPLPPVALSVSAKVERIWDPAVIAASYAECMRALQGKGRPNGLYMLKGLLVVQDLRAKAGEAVAAARWAAEAKAFNGQMPSYNFTEGDRHFDGRARAVVHYHPRHMPFLDVLGLSLTQDASAD